MEDEVPFPPTSFFHCCRRRSKTRSHSRCGIHRVRLGAKAVLVPTTREATTATLGLGGPPPPLVAHWRTPLCCSCYSSSASLRVAEPKPSPRLGPENWPFERRSPGNWSSSWAPAATTSWRRRVVLRSPPSRTSRARPWFSSIDLRTQPRIGRMPFPHAFGVFYSNVWNGWC
jgi:hypothetical protein